MSGEKIKCYCNVCTKTIGEDKFYKSNNKEKYPPDGRLSTCKACLTMHIDNWDERTFLPILEELDVPYIKAEWDKILTKYIERGTKMTGMSILGRYLSLMKLTQWKDYRWSDTEALKERDHNIKVKALELQGLSEEEIAEIVKKDAEKDNRPPAPVVEDPIEDLGPALVDVSEYMDLDLTDEDKKSMLIKWGAAYSPYEWVKLEQYYEDMCESFDIQTPSHKDYLKLICKTSLKAHKLADANDVEGFQRLSKVYDSLMKSANFTAAQNKVKAGEYIDAIAELVEICEKEGFIPTYYDGTDHDKVDATLSDLKKYTYNLVNQETNLSALIENALQKIKIDKEKETDDVDNLDSVEDDIREVDEFLNSAITDNDFREHFDEVGEEIEETKNRIKKGVK